MKIYFSGNVQDNAAPEMVLSKVEDLAVMLTYGEITPLVRKNKSTICRFKRHAKQRRVLEQK